MIYLDYSATTPVLPEILNSFNKVCTEYIGNPNSMHSLGIKSKETLRSTYLDPAIKEGVIALTIPDKPTSKNQMYYKV